MELELFGFLLHLELLNLSILVFGQPFVPGLVLLDFISKGMILLHEITHLPFQCQLLLFENSTQVLELLQLGQFLFIEVPCFSALILDASFEFADLGLRYLYSLILS